MKFVDEFRDPAAVRQLLEAIRRRASRTWTIMEVCGGQTHGLLKYGFDQELEGAVELLHGPGCPVCVTGVEQIDAAVALAHRPDTLVATFGDMLRVPGSRQSLQAAQAAGGRVKAVYSPLDAVALAAQNPQWEVVFLAVGFETTAPATALAVLHADRYGLKNFSLLSAHVRVQPAMESLLRMPDCRVQGFLAAGHVCTVTGFRSYEALAESYRVPIVVTGFEPWDLAAGLWDCVDQLESGQHQVHNRYPRSVQLEGNRQALDCLEQVYQVCDNIWRGLGLVAGGGLRLRDRWAALDARHRFALDSTPQFDSPGCQSGLVLSGRIRPPDCPEFGRGCTPDNPLGAPMVSSEGACAAYFHYHRVASPVAEEPLSGGGVTPDHNVSRAMASPVAITNVAIESGQLGPKQAS